MRLASLLIRLLAASVIAVSAGVTAQDGGHWAYKRVERPLVDAQAIANVPTAWAATTLDQLAWLAMREQDLEPSLPADPAVWLRRVSLDLTGLPPTPADVAAFLADSGAAARAAIVDRLMESDAFAERWTAWWLDLARYADSQGYEKDGLRRGMYRYRDWVLQAFRRDLPFDQFTIQQLAGDLLPDATAEQQLATAFHRQTMSNTEGGTDNEEFRVAAVVDRVDTTMQVWMGSTLGCAQCHDHKYDPFSQREFFELFAFFDQSADADRDDDAPTMRMPTDVQRRRQRELGTRAERLRQELATAERLPMSDWHLLGPVKGKDFVDARDRAFAPERDGVHLDREQAGSTWALRADFVDGKVHSWQGANSAFYLHRLITVEEPCVATLSLGSDDALAVWCNEQEVLRKNVARGAKPDQERVDVSLQSGENDILLKVTNGGGPGGFCFELWGAAEAGRRKQLAALQQQLDNARGPVVPIMRDLPAEQQRTTRVHLRGSFLDQGDVVTPATPRVWPAFGEQLPRNRLGLARWLMHRDNPLTSRVISNRIWSELFGTGIVPMLEDFGSQGDAPSHPRLLDWLACELLDSGWSLRHLLKTIVLSATYGQTSKQTAAHRERDPRNRWLSRGPSFRLSAEQLRDQALAVSGLLHRELGGPSVMPPQPDGVWRQIYSGLKWTDATDEQRYRRALYTLWRRTSPHPAMLVFDAQSREACVLRRQRTNTPLQALVLWNDPQFFEPAQELARRAVDSANHDAGRIEWMWRQCLHRAPTARESQRLLQLLADERAREASEQDAFTAIAGVLLCLDEFVTRR